MAPWLLGQRCSLGQPKPRETSWWGRHAGGSRYRAPRPCDRAAPRPRARPSAPVVTMASTNFHQSRLAATERATAQAQRLRLNVRLAESDVELEAAAWLRAQSFYAYPPERKFAGELHQIMIAEEEYAALKVARMQRKLAHSDGGEPAERSACLVAVCAASEVPGVSERLLLGGEAGSSNGSGGQEAVVGTLDLHVAKALPGEVLIGSSSCAGYLANVCVAPAARRRRVGEELLGAARDLARQWGVLDLFVHTMAVNEVALRFYDRNGFVVEKEETSNQAHYRGRCLDGIEGRGRSVLLRDTQL